MQKKISTREAKRLENFAAERQKLRAEIVELQRELRAITNAKITQAVRAGIKAGDPDLIENLRQILEGEAAEAATLKTIKARTTKTKPKRQNINQERQ